MFKRIVCYFKEHDWEDIPKECLKDEYDLNIVSGKFCMRCNKSEIIKKTIAADNNKQRKDKIKSLFSDYLYWHTKPYPRQGVPRAPAPWNTSKPRIPLDD